MKIADWFEHGERFNGTPEGREEILHAIQDLTWHEPPYEDIPMSQGLAIQTLLKEVVKVRSTAIAYDGVIQRHYGLIGIEAEYRNGTFRIYWADTGTGLSPLCSEEV